MKQNLIFIRRSGKVHGPLPASRVLAALKEGRISVSDEFSLASTGPWLACAEFSTFHNNGAPTAGSYVDRAVVDDEDPSDFFGSLAHSTKNIPSLPSSRQVDSSAETDLDKSGISAAPLEWAVGIWRRSNQSGAVGAMVLLLLAGLPLAAVAATSPRLLIAVAVPVYCIVTITATFVLARWCEDNLFMFFFVSILGCVASGLPSLLYLLDWYGRTYEVESLLIADWVFWLTVIAQFGIGAYTLKLLVIDQVPLQWCVFYYTFYQLFVGLMVSVWLGTERVVPICLWLIGVDSFSTK
jgi:hypothetical protein